MSFRLDNEVPFGIGQGHVYQRYKYHKRNPGFLVAKIQEHFRSCPDWYRRSEVRDLVGPYYVVLRSVLRSKPQLRPCLSRCRHCRIFFLTHPRNAGRQDLGCPFGCQQAHRSRRSTERSVEYYRSPEGKWKKKLQNGKRRRQHAAWADAGMAVSSRQGERDGMRFAAEIVDYLRMVTSLIEGRRVRAEEILEMLVRAVRQHSIARRRRIDYVLAYSKEKLARGLDAG